MPYQGTYERYVRLVLLDVTDAEAEEFFERAHGCDLELELGNGGTYSARVETNVRATSATERYRKTLERIAGTNAGVYGWWAHDALKGEA